MKNFEDYLVKFVGLKVGEHQFKYQITNTFFDEFNYQEFQESDIQALVHLNKKNTHLEFDIHTKGIVEVECDLTLESFKLPIENTLSIIVKFGEDYNEIDEKLIVIPHGENQFDLKQYIYECIVLSIPSKKIHPGVEDGTLDSEILDRLNHLSVNKVEDTTEKKTDPRWDKLKKLL